MPDKAIDVIDEAAAKISSKNYEISTFISKTGFDTRQNVISDSYKNAEMPILSVNEIKEIINEMTGIPISGIGSSTKSEELHPALNKKIIGQDSAIDSLTRAVMRSELGINNPEHPKGVFLFLGKSGVGKTELAKALAEALFFDKSSFFRFDMSEFSDKISINKFIGSPPGYVGYEEGGSLTEKIRRHPYSVVLFDEIEKAHPDVLSLFLQITDSGTLTDSQGRSVSFKNCYIIFTSNVGSKDFSKPVGFVKSEKEKAERLKELLKEHFKTEFINRIDEIIPFSTLDRLTLTEIAKKKLEELKARLSELGIRIDFSSEVASMLADNSFDESYGARELIRIITNKVENTISSYILDNKSDNGYNLTAYVKDGEIVVTEKASAKV